MTIIVKKLGNLIMARCGHGGYNKVIKAGVPQHVFDDYHNMFVRKSINIKAYDEKQLCKPGDWVLLRQTEEPIDVDVDHIVERVVYNYGNYTDPLTGRRSLGLHYDEDVSKLENIKIDL